MSSRDAKITFVATISVLLIVGFLLTTLTSFTVSRKALRSEIRENELPLTSDNIYAEIQHDLMFPVVISSLMASDTFVRDWIISGEKDVTLITKYLAEVQKKYGMCSSFLVSDRTKTYYYPEGILKKVSRDEPRDAWYYRVRDMAKDYEINTDPDLANKDRITIFINHRVFDYDGNFIGAIGVGLTKSAVLNLIEIYQAKYARTVYFFDASGAIKLAGCEFNSAVENISQIAGADFNRQDLSKTQETSFSYRRDGRTLHVNVRYVEEWGWYLAVEKADEQAMRGIVHALFLSLIVCAFVTIVITVLVNRSIGRYQKRIALLRGILPICAHCDKVRDENGRWSKVETYIARHTQTEFTHSICPDCMQEHYPDVSDDAAPMGSDRA